MATRVIAILVVIAGCGGGTLSPPGPPPPYLPLAVGNAWRFTCGAFSITDSVLGTVSLAGHTTYEYALQIPDSNGTVTTLVQLLANDAMGNTSIYGYLSRGVVTAVAPTVIIAANPSVNAPFNYPTPGGGTVERAFKGIDSSHPTPLGTFSNDVAVYYEGGGVNNYGYVSGKGIVERDHANFKFDCLVSSVQLH